MFFSPSLVSNYLPDATVVAATVVAAAVVAPAVVAATDVAAAVVAEGAELHALERELHVYGPQLFRLNMPHFPPHCWVQA